MIHPKRPLRACVALPAGGGVRRASQKRRNRGRRWLIWPPCSREREKKAKLLTSCPGKRKSREGRGVQEPCRCMRRREKKKRTTELARNHHRGDGRGKKKKKGDATSFKRGEVTRLKKYGKKKKKRKKSSSIPFVWWAAAGKGKKGKAKLAVPGGKTWRPFGRPRLPKKREKKIVPQTQ